MQVQALWSTVVGPLLTASSGPSAQQLYAASPEQLLQYLPPMPAVNGPAGAAAAAPDPRVRERGSLYEVLYHAQCVLKPPGEQAASLQPVALLGVSGRGLVEQDSEKLIWALLYDPQHVPTWQQLAAFYRRAVERLMADAAASVTVEVRLALLWTCRPGALTTLRRSVSCLAACGVDSHSREMLLAE
jgi:hypothetical protein